MLSPTLFYIYTSDTPTPLAPVKLTTYADDITIKSTHSDINIAKGNIQSYLHEIHTWTRTNNLILNPDNTTCTLFTPDPADYSTQLKLQIDNITLPMNINPKILGLTLDPKLTCSKHIEITTTKARKTIQILKALTSTTWGEQKKTIIATYKAITRPILQCVSTIWSPLASDTNISKLQITQNTALRIATGCTRDTNTEPLHDETHTISIREHLQLHASQKRQKSQQPTHPLHYITTQQTTPRRKKQTTYNNTDYTTNIDTNPNTLDDAKIMKNMKHIHTTIVSTYLNNRQHNKVTNTTPLTVHYSETTLPRTNRHTLTQLRTNKCPLVRSY